MRTSFTIIELMLAIGIIGTIAGIVVAAINPSDQLVSAQNASRRATAREIGQAIIQYEIDNGAIASIPVGIDSALPICRQDINGSTNCVNLSVIAPDYLIEIPQDGASGEPSLTGYKVYRDGPTVQVIAELIGTSGGTINLITDGLLSWWPFDDMTGTTVADIAGSHDGTMLDMDPGTDWVSTGAPLQFTNSGCLAFDGLNDRISVPDTDELVYTGGDMTISLWAYSTDASTQSFLFSKPWNGAGKYNYYVSWQTTPALRTAFQGDTFWGTTAGNLYNNDWIHIAMTVNANREIKRYINGELVYTSVHTVTDWDNPPNGDSDVALAIGTLYPYGGTWAGNTGHAFEGYIDDVRLYNRTLSAAEIAQIASGNG